MRKVLILQGKNQQWRTECALALTVDAEMKTVLIQDMAPAHAFAFADIKPDTEAVIFSNKAAFDYEAFFSLIAGDKITIHRKMEEPFSMPTPIFVICDNETSLLPEFYVGRFDVIDLDTL